MLKSLINYKTKSLNKSAGILTVSAVISKMLGVVRNWLLAKSFGAGSELDVYFTAFKIPDFIYNILILGGMLVSFLPLFSEYFSKNKEFAWKFTSNLLNIFIVSLIALSLILFFFTPSLIDIIAPGFNYQQAEQAIALTRIMLLSPIFFSLSSIFSGILQYFNKFFIYSLSPVIYNLGIISGILFLSPKMGILGVVLGVVFGTFLHFAIQIPSVIDCGFQYKAVFDLDNYKISKVFSLMLPRMFGVSAQQINLIITNAIASTLAEGSITIFNFANNIQYFPVGIIGVPFAVAAFPTLSKNLAKNDKEKFIDNFSKIFNQIVYLALPATIFIFLLREEIVGILLQHGLFSSLSAKLSSSSLALFCLGILASALIPLLFRVFFALQDTKTPTLIALFSMLVNITLSFLFTKEWFYLHQKLRNIFSFLQITDVAVLGLPLAFSMAIILQFVLMVLFLKDKFKEIDFEKIGVNFLKVLFSSLILFFSRYVLKFLVSEIFPTQSLFLDFFQIFIIGTIGSLIYLLVTLILSVPSTDLILAKIFKNARN